MVCHSVGYLLSDPLSNLSTVRGWKPHLTAEYAKDTTLVRYSTEINFFLISSLEFKSDAFSQAVHRG